MRRCQPETTARQNAWQTIGLGAEYKNMKARELRETALRAIAKANMVGGNSTGTNCECYREGICSHCSLSSPVVRNLLLQATGVKLLTGGTTSARLLAIFTAPQQGQEFVVRTYGRKSLINNPVMPAPHSHVIAAQIGHMVGAATPRAVIVDFDEELCMVLRQIGLSIEMVRGFCAEVNQSMVFRALVTDLISTKYFSYQVPAILQSTPSRIFAFDLLTGRSDLFLGVWGDYIELNQRNLLRSGSSGEGSNHVVIDLDLTPLKDSVSCTYSGYRMRRAYDTGQKLERNVELSMSSMLKSNEDLDKFVQCSMGQVLDEFSINVQKIEHALLDVVKQSNAIHSLLDHYMNATTAETDLLFAIKTRLSWIGAAV